jgi:hypothetical protein
MKEQIRLNNGKKMKINDPDVAELQNLDDHDLLIIMHTQMINLRSEVKDIRKNFAPKWVQHVVTFIIVGFGSAVITGLANLVVHAVGGN